MGNSKCTLDTRCSSFLAQSTYLSTTYCIPIYIETGMSKCRVQVKEELLLVLIIQIIVKSLRVFRLPTNVEFVQSSNEAAGILDLRNWRLADDAKDGKLSQGCCHRVSLFFYKKEENVTSHYKAIGLEVTHSFSIVLGTKSDNKVLLGYNHIHSNRSLSYQQDSILQ